MSTLALYRDDGPLARLLWRALAPLTPGGLRDLGHRFRWAGPPLLRAAEYAGLLWIGEAGGALPAAFALCCALTFRHYDLVYRLRHQGTEPPEWVGAVAGGWDGRLIAGAILLAAGALPAGFYVLAAVLGALFAAESTASWRRFLTAQAAVTEGRATYEEGEGEAE